MTFICPLLSNLMWPATLALRQHRPIQQRKLKVLRRSLLWASKTHQERHQKCGFLGPLWWQRNCEDTWHILGWKEKIAMTLQSSLKNTLIWSKTWSSANPMVSKSWTPMPQGVSRNCDHLVTLKCTGLRLHMQYSSSSSSLYPLSNAIVYLETLAKLKPWTETLLFRCSNLLQLWYKRWSSFWATQLQMAGCSATNRSGNHSL